MFLQLKRMCSGTQIFRSLFISDVYVLPLQVLGELPKAVCNIAEPFLSKGLPVLTSPRLLMSWGSERWWVVGVLFFKRRLRLPT